MCQIGWDRREEFCVQPIPDHLKKGLKIIFVGFNPGLNSWQIGHHYANPNNRFWTVLFMSGLTPHQYRPEQDAELLGLGYGLTNIPRPTRAAADITKEEYEEGRKILRAKIRRLKPKIVCFVGKGVYQQYSGRREVDWGVQPQPTTAQVVDFVAPSTSGLVRMPLAEMVAIYQQLAALVHANE